MTEITMNGDFEHNDELKSSITLTIKNPEVDKEYKKIKIEFYLILWKYILN